MQPKFLRRQIADERGLSLVEIPIAVTVMSIISVTIMGYFVSAMDKSAEESRRIIAANLARLKAAEIRNAFGNSAKYGTLKSGIYTSANGDLLENRLGDTVINGTTYRYTVTLEDDGREHYLFRMLVRVDWSDVPSAATSTTHDTHVVKRW